MRESPDARLPEEAGLHRFLDRSLLFLEWGSLATLLLLTLAQPTSGRLGVPTWALVLLFAAYLLPFDLIRNRVRRLHSFRLKYALALPVSALVYALGAEPGGPLFILFFVAVVCASATLTPRESMFYTATAAVLVTFVELVTLPSGAADLQGLGGRLALLALFGANTAILDRRIALEREAARLARGKTERLGELDRLRENFVSSISHNLRTPLTATRAGLGLLEASASERLLVGERDLLENARRNTARLGMIVDDLLAYNQLEAGTLKLEREPLDLRAAVVDAISTVHPLIMEKGQTLEMDLPEPLPVEGDPRRLEQVVVNLLENAHLHTPEGTRIGVSGRASGAEVSLSVSDTGPGIPAGELESVFERFRRLESGSGNGSGIGLTISRGIVGLHGGRLRAESPPGGGATFRMTLPLGREGEEKEYDS
jgi:signal transduction histidine kinase